MESLHRKFLTILFISGIVQQVTAQQNQGLKAKFRNNFVIGAALDTNQIMEKEGVVTKLIREQFNAVTPENIMKAEHIHPDWNQYDFYYPDKMIDFAKKYKMQVNGHTLIWHSQLPAFAKKIIDKDSFQIFFRQHIETIASHFEGRIFSWDVVNEALNEDGSLRNSIFREKLGDDYIVEAFRIAQKSSPHSELYYNDYNIEQPAKRAGCIALIKRIQAAGVRIDGVGIQGHWHLGKIPLKEIEESIREFSALGLKVMITELDVEVLPRNFSGAEVSKRMASDPSLNPYTSGLPEAQQKQQAADYASLFNLFQQYKGKLTRVTFWGVNDGQSWLNNWPVRGRTNYPLLFDRNYQPKDAYYEVMKLTQDK